MAGFVRLLLLVAICLIRGHHQLADPELFEAGGLFGSPYDRSGYESDVFELLPYEDRYHPPRPPRIKLVRKPPPKPLPPLNTVQNVVLTKPPPSHAGSYSMSYTLGAVMLALLGQAVGTVFFMVMAKLLLGIKTILATNSATLGLALWNHLKKMKHKKMKKIKPHKGHKEHHKKKKKKTKTPEVNLVQLSKKQLKKIFKLLMKKKKKGH